MQVGRTQRNSRLKCVKAGLNSVTSRRVESLIERLGLNINCEQANAVRLRQRLQQRHQNRMTMLTMLANLTGRRVDQDDVISGNDASRQFARLQHDCRIRLTIDGRVLQHACWHRYFGGIQSGRSPTHGSKRRQHNTTLDE